MKTVVVDADAFIALINKDDVLAAEAIKIFENLYASEVKLVYPSTNIVEAITTFQRKLNAPALASDMAQMLSNSQFNIISVDQNTFEIAETLFKPDGSKRNTMFDAVVAAVAKITRADAVFSFDKWYEKIGLKLATNLT